DDFVHGSPRHLRRHHGRWRIGSHAARVRSLVAVERAFVVLGGGKRDGSLTIAESEERGLLADQKLLDHDFGAGAAKRAVEYRLDGSLRLRNRLRDHDA